MEDPTQYYSVADNALFTPDRDADGNAFIGCRIPLPLKADWKPPVILPLVKLDKPDDAPGTHRYVDILVVYDDRVERDWQLQPLTEEELAAATRKVWSRSAEFLSEFSMAEMAAISLSTDPTIAALRLLLAAWPLAVHSDDERIIGGLDQLVSVGILTPERRSEIVTK